MPYASRVAEPDSRLPTPKAVAVTYLFGALAMPFVDALTHRIGGLANLLLVPFVVLVILVAEFLRRKTPTYLWRSPRIPVSDCLMLHGMAAIMFGVGGLASLPLRPPIVRRGPGLVASLCLSGIPIAVGVAIVVMEFRRQRRTIKLT